MKRVTKTIAFLLVSLIIGTTLTATAAGEGWFIVKRKNECPGFPQSASILDLHKCYYIDKSASQNGEKVIYLTFDAGYENGNVGKILDILAAKGATAAFFVLSNIICKNPELILRMQNEGHTVCNHTRNHKNLTKLTEEESEEIKNED